MPEYPHVTGGTPPDPYGQYPATPPAPPKRKRRIGLWVAIAAAVAVAAGVGSTAVSGPAKHAATVAPRTSAAPVVHAPPVSHPASVTSEAPPAAVPEPDGTVTGTCAYELATDVDTYETHAADLNAEVDAENTGNVGIVLTVTTSFPQLAHAPIVMSKKVKVPYGRTVTVRFTRPINQSQITRLQDWQSGHDYDDGCVYKGTITDTYGAAH